MRVLVILVCCAVAAGLLLSCGDEATREEPVVEIATPTAVAPEPVGAPEMVIVTAEGSSLEPPVSVEQIPDGAWYCDMGTVHYARLEKGDGRCAACGMELVQKQGSAPVDEAADSGYENQE